MTSNSSKYGINDTVEVFGFPTKCAHLNGKLGTITGFNPKTMNSTVKLNGKYTTIPEGNMRPATTAAAAGSNFCHPPAAVNFQKVVASLADSIGCSTDERPEYLPEIHI